ncbi:RluA family pseudouridine synthase [Cohnella algarum]|uniref:RluA family pseudouridine synthase n=1 Tax=Cohnella algarum TaxID=2044859 RepID=UPI0023DDC79D|nr:RluA family pseudouridine synthase [Cohnella algarum]
MSGSGRNRQRNQERNHRTDRAGARTAKAGGGKPGAKASAAAGRGAGSGSRRAETGGKIARAGGRSAAAGARFAEARGRTAGAGRSAAAGGKFAATVGGGAAASGRRLPAGAAAGAPPKLGRRRGDWVDVKLPDGAAGAPLPQAMKLTPLPPKLIAKLLQSKGAQLQGSTLRLQLFPDEERDFPPDWMELNVLYEDDFTLVVNKPSGIEVHPSEKGQRRTLAHAVSSYYEMSNQNVRIRHIHRIDKETTGPVLYAKNEFAHYQYDKAMREKKIERIYLALAEGVIAQDKGKIDKPIGQDRHHSTRRRVSETGDPAVTHYEVVERFGDHTLVRLRLETGRTHQIRVHLSAIGHPLAGDGLYGGKRGLISRQALHGERLLWFHPWTGEKLSVSAPLPDDFGEALKRLRER